MYTSSPLPAPLSHGMFYILLALARGEAHGYDLGAIAQEELQRLEYALKIGQAARITNKEVPLEIQKWLDSVR